jgi:membrane protease subunit HflC
VSGKRVVGLLVFWGALALLGAGSLYVVSEGEQVVITQFGAPVGRPVTDAGLHVKRPVIQEVNRFDRRFLEWDGAPTQIPTFDKKFIWVNAVVRWRIHDALLFFQRVHDERGAQSRLDDILDGETRNAIAKHPLVEIARSSNREFVPSDELMAGEENEIFQKISFGREVITREILTNSRPRLVELGIEILDVRLKRVNYVEEVRKKVFERMVSERMRIAAKYRSEGQGESARILGGKEKELKVITSEAYRRAQEIVGKADAEAARIYAEAYGRDQEFYRFTKTLDTYRATIDKGTLLLLGTDGEFYRYLKESDQK